MATSFSYSYLKSILTDLENLLTKASGKTEIIREEADRLKTDILRKIRKIFCFYGMLLCGSIIALSYILTSWAVIKERLPLNGWTAWGQIKTNMAENTVLFSGSLDSSAGYDIERKLPFGGKRLHIMVKGSDKQTFLHNQMFKLEANGHSLEPIEKERINMIDKNYVNSGDGEISFQLPSPLTKLGFVFFRSTMNNLEISGYLYSSLINEKDTKMAVWIITGILCLVIIFMFKSSYARLTKK